MPEYVYRREDGSTFTIKQKFLDDPLTVDPETGQKVVRIMQPAGIIFKGSGFYVTDSRGKNTTSSSTPSSKSDEGETKTASDSTEKKPNKTEKTEKKETKSSKSEAAD